MYLMGSWLGGGASPLLGKVGVRRAGQSAGLASVGADVTVRFVRGICGEEAGRVMRTVASARAAAGTATRVGSGCGSIALIAA